MKEKREMKEQEIIQSLERLNPAGKNPKVALELKQSELRIWNNIKQMVEFEQVYLEKRGFLDRFSYKPKTSYIKITAVLSITALSITAAFFAYTYQAKQKQTNLISQGSIIPININSINSTEDLASLVAAQNKRLYGVTDLEAPFTEDQLRNLQELSRTGTVHKKYETKTYKDINGKPVSEDKEYTTSTVETWNNGLYYKCIISDFIVVETPDSEFTWQWDTTNNQAVSKLNNYPKGKNPNSFTWVNRDLYQVYAIINSSENMPSWSKHILVNKVEEKDKITLEYELNTGPITTEQIKANHAKAERFYNEHKREIDSGNQELGMQLSELYGPKGFNHTKTYIDIYKKDNSVFLSRQDSFTQDNSLQSQTLLTQLETDIPFNVNIFDYTKSLPVEIKDIKIETFTEKFLELMEKSSQCTNTDPIGSPRPKACAFKINIK